ncbi:MAG TPA: hypothetical protein VMZ53_12865 [Kofleriaceae bacterium]|nr:hypothetical protein [Kofleriaceae bacterium]
MKPEAVPAPTSCVALMPRIRAAVVAYDASYTMLVDHALPTILASCLNDDWPLELRTCIAQSNPDALAHEHACEKLVPVELEKKLRARLTP